MHACRNELVYVVCALSSSLDDKTDGKKEATNRRRFCVKSDFASVGFFLFKEPRTAKNRFSIFLFGMGRSVVS